MGAVTLAPGINAIRPATVRIRGSCGERRCSRRRLRRSRLKPHVVCCSSKHEALQVTGSSFKPRGAVDAQLALPSARLQRVRNRFGGQSRARGGPSRLGGRNTSDDFLPSSVASDKLSKFAAWAGPDLMA